MYKKIYKYMRLIFTVTLVLSVLLVFLASFIVGKDSVLLCVITSILAVCIYALMTLLAKRLTDLIVKPIVRLDLDSEEGSDEVYEELAPLIKQISRQNREIRRQMERVQTQKARLQTISENMNEGLVTLDANGTVIFANPGALHLFNTTEEDVRQKNYQSLTQAPTLCTYIEAALSGEKKTTQYTMRDATYHVFFNPVFDHGAPGGAIILFFDVTENERTEQIRREFSANVSHELKTPLTTILGYSQMISNGMAKKEDVAQFACKIEGETTRLIALIEDIIKLSNLDEQGFLDNAEPVRIAEVVEEVTDSLKQPFIKKDITLLIDVDPQMCILGNRAQLTELVYNLCDNAISYNVDGGSVSITAENSKISVTDTGIGISPENQKRVFERFYRVDKSHSKKVNGTGLGLSIVKHVALCHNAHIDMVSALGKGTTITVDFSVK